MLKDLMLATCVFVCVPIVVHAATSEANFQVKTTRDLVTLCATPPSDPLATAAVNFCEGYAVGAYQYDQVVEAASGWKPMFCPPSPPPSRNDAISQFIAWSKTRVDYLDRSPIDGIFAFLSERYPCRN